MRVLMLSWEYPPLVVGGLGRHVEALARALAAAGHDVRVVCRGESAGVVEEVRDGVRVVRAAVDPIDIGFTIESLLAWSQAGEHALVRAALPLLPGWRPDVVHAHDWLVAQAGITLSEVAGAPLVATLHATEAGRHQGWLPEPLNRAIHSVERWLASRADAVITCSQTMRAEVASLGLAPSSVAVVPNGIEPARWRPTARERREARTRFAGEGPVLAFAGRLVHEKGVQTLLHAVRPLRETCPQLRLAIAGTGGHEAELRAIARRQRIARAVDWLGFVPETELPAVLAAADVVVVPSFYEPFGIVALEAAAVATPLVVAETGGLRDLVDAGLVAGSFPAGDVDALATAVGKVLADPATAERDAARSARTVRRRFGWTAVATRTVEVYEGARRSFTTRAGTPTATL
ncbi:MAG TPA: glycosyltransferase family 4 protein [Jatrophihabitans sp.]|uniref:glycosyltransferase family 4 protein n=1 Tax=Jatrophihabitans sp. TaxID=1932789 RepID=UPI002E080F6B|nr:glycosyltransferase family 4 protein [Jatrophihabitans sp.]